MPSKRSPVEEDVAMDMTPMIDVTFQLLIFFIITLKFKLLEKKLDSHLPTNYGLGPGPLVEENFMTVKLIQDKSSDGPIRERTTRYFLNGDEITASSSDQLMATLKTRLGAFRNKVKDAVGKIETGTGVPHREVVRVLDVFHRSGFEKISYTGMWKTGTAVQGKNHWQKIRKELGDLR